MEDLTGMRLGQYQVIAPLGEGGMASVYRAYQPSVDRQVVLKILPRHFARDPEFTGRFEQEAKLIAKLQHVHILPVYDFGEAEGYTYIVMPYIETGTLAEVMRGEPMPPAQVRGVITQVAEALAFAHERGLVHRDVKPSNILIDHAGNCLLTDFGIAKIVEGTAKFTQTGAIIGTPAYMSPEQIRGETLDGRSDQYSLGIVLYEMATGRPPFRAETPPAIFVKHLHDPLPPPSTINPDLPEELERVILKCLAKNPEDRFPSMREMSQAIERAIPRRRPEPEDQAQVGLAPTVVREPAEQPARPAPTTDAPPEQPVAQPAGVPVGAAAPEQWVAEPAGAKRRIPTWAMIGGGALVVIIIGGLGAWAIGGLLGPGEREAATPAPTQAAAAVEPTPVNLAGSTVTILTAAGEEQIHHFEGNFAGFEAETGIDVIVEGSPEFEAVARGDLEGGGTYDILNFPQPGLMADLARAGLLVDLGQFISRGELRAAYAQSWIDLGTVDGKVYGIWHGADVKSLVWYAKPAWEFAGYPIPQNWDDLIAVSEQIVADGGVPWCIGIESGYATGWVATDWIEDILLRTTSTEVYDAWTRGELPFDSPEVKNAFGFLADIWFNQDYVLGGRDGILSTHFGDATLPLFDDPPGCWMNRQASFAASFFPEGTEVGIDVGFFYLPPIDEAYGRPVLGSGNLISLAKDTPAGREVVRFMMTPESVKAEVQAGAMVAPMNGVPLMWYPSDAHRGFAEILNSADTFRFDGSDMMPGPVGAGSFWAGMVDFVNGAELDAVLRSIDASWPGRRAQVGGCADPLGCVEVPPDEPVHIAYLLTLSGPTESLGLDSLGGIELAIDDRGGSLLGHPIRLTGEDSGCSADVGPVAAGRLLTDPSIVGIIGTNCSSAMIASIGMLSEPGLTVISPTNTAPDLTFEGQHWQPGYFRTAHSDLYQGKLAATFAREVLGLRRAATIHDGSPYGAQLAQLFAENFEALGGTIVFREQIDAGESEFQQLLTRAAEQEPHIIYLLVFEPQGSQLVRQARANPALGGTILMGADSLLIESFPEAAGPGAVGMYLTGPYVAGPEYEAMLQRWEAKFGGAPPGGFHAFAYDAANLLLDAIERIAAEGPGGSLVIGRQALREAVTMTEGFPGISGPLSCGDKDFGELGISRGDCATGQALAVFEIGEREVGEGRWPPDLAWRPDW